MTSPRIVLVEYCDFVRFPTGGQLSFARQMLTAFGTELALVGIATDAETPVGEWTKREIGGTTYDYFAVARECPQAGKKLVPARIRALFAMRRHRRAIRKMACVNYLVQAPEIFLVFQQDHSLNIGLRLAGLENPLSLSRYAYGPMFANLYDRIFYPRLNRASVLLAAADRDAIRGFAEKSRGLVTQDRVRQFPTRYDNRVFFPREKHAARQRLALDTDKTLIVTVGRLNEHKGWRFLIDSFIEFRRSSAAATLLFIGDGEDHDRIVQHANDRGLSEDVVLLGRARPSEIAEYLAACDLFVMGSHAEGWCTALQEAVVSAVPVCTTRFSSADELVREGVNGFIVDRDPVEFSKMMKLALDLPRAGLLVRAAELEHLSICHLRRELLSAWSLC